MHSRNEWTTRKPNFSSARKGVRDIFIHHEGGGARGNPPDKAAVLRQIESYVLNKGYIAIDYNVMVFNDGDVWAGRELWNEDAATINNNPTSVSICAVGNYQIEPAPDSLVNGIKQAIREIVESGYTIRNPSIRAHKDVFSTACPGRNLIARMDELKHWESAPKPPEGPPPVEHGMAVDAVCNPSDPTKGYVLDRWGGITAFGGAIPPQNGPYWQGQDVARRLIVTDWNKPQGYVLDLKGAMHGWGSPKAPELKGTPYWKTGVVVPINEI